MDFTTSIELEMDESKSDDLVMRASPELEFSKPKHTPNKGIDDNSSKCLSPTIHEGRSDSIDMCRGRKSNALYRHLNHSPSPAQIKAASNNSSHQSDVESCAGNVACRTPPGNEMESFMYSPSSSNVSSSDVDLASSKIDDQRRMASKQPPMDLRESLSMLSSSVNFPPPSLPPPPLPGSVHPSFAKFQLANRIDERHRSSDLVYSNHSEAYLQSDTNTSSSNKRANITFSVENILAPNKFGQQNLRELSNVDSKDHSEEDDEEEGKLIFKGKNIIHDIIKRL